MMLLLEPVSSSWSDQSQVGAKTNRVENRRTKYVLSVRTFNTEFSAQSTELQTQSDEERSAFSS